MKLQSFLHLLACLFVLVGCGSSASPATPQIVSVYSTFAAEPWLPPLYECAGTSSVLSRVDDPAQAQIILRVGEPSLLSSFAYQIDNEEILVVTHRQSPVQNLNAEGVPGVVLGSG